MIKKSHETEDSLLLFKSIQDSAESGILTRRDFLGFFLLGGIISLLSKKVHAEQKPKEAMFWKRLD